MGQEGIARPQRKALHTMKMPEQGRQQGQGAV
jgi:hypothetical protein